MSNDLTPLQQEILQALNLGEKTRGELLLETSADSYQQLTPALNRLLAGHVTSYVCPVDECLKYRLAHVTQFAWVRR